MGMRSPKPLGRNAKGKGEEEVVVVAGTLPYLPVVKGQQSGRGGKKRWGWKGKEAAMGVW